MANLADLFPGQPQAQFPPELQQAMGQVQGNIAQLLSKSGQGPSIGDLGHSLLMSAAYGGQVPYTQFLHQNQDQQYQMVNNQANLVNSSVQMYMNAAKQKAQSNPLAGFFVDAMQKMPPEQQAKMIDGLEKDPRPFSPELFAEYATKTRLPEVPKVVGYDIPGGATGVQHVDEVWQPGQASPLNSYITDKRDPSTNINVKMPSQIPPAPTGYMYSAVPEEGKPMQLQKIPGGPVGDVSNAAKAATLKTALDDAKVAQDIFLPGGKVNRTTVTTGSMGLFQTEGRRGSLAMERAIDTLIKLRTGAAAGETEMEQYKRDYIPSINDNEQTIREKFNRFNQFVSETQSAVESGTITSAPQGQPSKVTPTDIDKMNEQQLDEYIRQNGSSQ